MPSLTVFIQDAPSPLVIWDTLAIIEFCQEYFQLNPLVHWPNGVEQKVLGKSMCFELHSGFLSLRDALPFNICQSFPDVSEHCSKKVLQDVARLDQMLKYALEKYSTPHPDILDSELFEYGWLFGRFSLVDLYFASTAFRLRTYGFFMDPLVSQWMKKITTLFEFQYWEHLAYQEPWIVDNFEWKPQTDTVPLHLM